jgi:opacity protein-like surface antigen
MLQVAALLCSLEASAKRAPAVPPLPSVVRSTDTETQSGGSPNAIALLPTREKPHSRWWLSYETSYLFATTNNPFIWLVKTKQEGPNPLHYRLATQVLSVRYELTQPGGWAFLRGNFEWSGGILYSAVVHGPEDYIVGAVSGLRYNFVPRHSRFSPYIELRFGVSVTNASHVRQGQQQDQTFGYLLGAGVNYRVDPRWQVSVGTINQHESNLFQTDPNYGFNVMGVSLGVKRRF